MSYDLRIMVKVEGCDKYAVIGYPEYDSPTYNLTKMFKECMDWDFEQSVNYPAQVALKHIDNGIMELSGHPEKYEQYNPPNGWGSLEGALKALESARKCIFEYAEEYPIECLYFRW